MATTERRPSDAYYEVAELLGDDHFCRPAAGEGRLLVIMGRDHIETRWHLDRLTAAHLSSIIHSRVDLAVLKDIGFDQRSPSP